jgi:molybdenum ABC transporter molybdate-binding protein
MKTAVITALVVLVVVGAVLVWQASSATQTLYLAIPQGIFVPMTEVMMRFQDSHPRVDFITTVDTPEAMVQAVRENPEKPDIFISPGGHEAELLSQEGYLEADTMVAFGSYKLAVLVPKENPGGVYELDDLLNPDVTAISFSDPDINGACHAARQAFKNLGMWEALQPKIAVTGCCMESFKWILDGRAEANIQFLGCPMDPETADMASQEKVSIAALFPADTHYVPRNVAGILTTTEKRDLAEEFLEFLVLPETIELMAEHRMRNDQDLPLTPGGWGPEQELGPGGDREEGKA